MAASVAARFFYREAGYSYDPATETRNAGRWRCAKALAKAEAFGRERGYHFVWIEDGDCIGCECGSKDCACASGRPHEVLTCVVYAPEGLEFEGWHVRGNVLASLGSICEPSADYRRVVMAELAEEAAANEGRKIA